MKRLKIHMPELPPLTKEEAERLRGFRTLLDRHPEWRGKVTLLQDKDQRIRQARLHIVEFRGFEKFPVYRKAASYDQSVVLVYRVHDLRTVGGVIFMINKAQSIELGDEQRVIGVYVKYFHDVIRPNLTAD